MHVWYHFLHLPHIVGSLLTTLGQRYIFFPHSFSPTLLVVVLQPTGGPAHVRACSLSTNVFQLASSHHSVPSFLLCLCLLLRWEHKKRNERKEGVQNSDKANSRRWRKQEKWWKLEMRKRGRYEIEIQEDGQKAEDKERDDFWLHLSLPIIHQEHVHTVDSRLNFTAKQMWHASVFCVV